MVYFVTPYRPYRAVGIGGGQKSFSPHPNGRSSHWVSKGEVRRERTRALNRRNLMDLTMVQRPNSAWDETRYSFFIGIQWTVKHKLLRFFIEKSFSTGTGQFVPTHLPILFHSDSIRDRSRVITRMIHDPRFDVNVTWQLWWVRQTWAVFYGENAIEQ